MKQQRNTRQRELILNAVMHFGGSHPCAGDVYAAVHETDEHISRGTVYRNLGLLSDDGKISRVRLPGCERYDCRTDEHGHVLCRSCGKLLDAPLPYDTLPDAAVEAETDFSDISHRIIFEGVCPDCRAASEDYLRG